MNKRTKIEEKITELEKHLKESLSKDSRVSEPDITAVLSEIIRLRGLIGED